MPRLPMDALSHACILWGRHQAGLPGIELERGKS